MMAVHSFNVIRARALISGSFFFCSLFFFSILFPGPLLTSAEAEPSSRVTLPPRNPAFEVPIGLRARVNFWIDIFTKYDKYHVVIHHREYPQIVFGVLDFTADAASMDVVSFGKYREAKVNAATDLVVSVAKRMATGDRPRNETEERIAGELQKIPDADRYRAIVEDPELVRSQTGIRERQAEAYARSGMYLPQIERIFVQEFRLPVELTRLPFVESSFNYRAYSKAGAAGMWQIMPRTARGFLSINRAVDERRDPIAATYFAANYLKSAYEHLGSWPLAVTAYNNGPVGVQRKVSDYGTTDITRLIERPGDKPFGFASSNYYPEFLAALAVFDAPQRYYPEVQLSAPIDTARVKLKGSIPISQVARRLNTSIEMLQQVNLSLDDNVWSGRVPVPSGYEVQVPHRAAVALAKLNAPELAAPTPTPAHAAAAYAAAYYRVKKGDTLESIAKKYRISKDSLKKLNPATSSHLRIGEQVVVAETGVIREKQKPAAQTKPKVTYVVKSGDSLHKIAAKFGVSVSQIRDLNKLSSTKLKQGQELTIENASKK